MQPKILISIRKTLGLTQSQLAGELGVNISTIVRWEKGYVAIGRRAEQQVKHLAELRKDGAAA